MSGMSAGGLAATSTAVAASTAAAATSSRAAERRSRRAAASLPNDGRMRRQLMAPNANTVATSASLMSSVRP